MNSWMESAAVDAFLFQMLQLMRNCFMLPQNEIVAVFYYFAMLQTCHVTS